MANYQVTDTELIATANAIRGKTSGITNIIWSSGKGFADEIMQISSSTFAFIKVTYPSGSICTVTNGIVTLTATDTSGYAVFGIPEPTNIPEAWTVSCTDGIVSDYTTINIENYGQNELIKLSYISSILNDNRWHWISDASKEGIADTYWDVGDCKEIILNGTIGQLEFNNETVCVFILDFNHPINKTTPDNNIIWGGFKSSLTNGIDIALCDSVYDSTPITNGTKYFNMNHWGNYNYGGWKGSDFRYDILGATSNAPSGYTSAPNTSRTGYNATETTINNPVTNTLMAALPNDFRAVLRLWNRYIDFKGNRSNTNNNCATTTIDAISLLTEYEVFGTKVYANIYEEDHQKQMTYYSVGNSSLKYKHNNTSSHAHW